MARDDLLLVIDQERPGRDAITSAFPVKLLIRKLHSEVSGSVVAAPFFVRFNAEFGSSIGGLLSELPTIRPLGLRTIIPTSRDSSRSNHSNISRTSR